MSYFKLLGLEREPFSTSPDPHFFYGSMSHLTALRRLELSIRLRRGLSLIFGDVGMGKTVLCRVLAQEFLKDAHVVLHMMLDPDCSDQKEFVQTLSRMFKIRSAGDTVLSHKEELERFLFQQGVRRGRIIVCVIDEGQKLSRQNLELLRTLLNYETNEYKLLQLVIFAQNELVPVVQAMPNLLDRASLRYTLNPLDEAECAQLISFRLKQAGYAGRKHLFSDESMRLISRYTKGYPRKIAMLCHDALKTTLIQGRFLVEPECIQQAALNLELPL